MRIIYPEYRDENQASNYPFADAATLTSRDKLVLPADMLIDASVFPIGGGARLYISSVVVGNRAVTIWIGDVANAQLASCAFDPLAPPDTLALADAYGRPAGMFVADPRQLAAAQSWSVGTHTFDLGTTEFAASCTIPTPEGGVRGLAAAQGILLTGDAWLVGEDGVVLSEEDGHIRVDVVGNPLFARQQCGPLGLFNTPRVLKTINGILPGPDGGFQLAVATASAADTVLRIVPEPPDTLRIGLVGNAVHG